MRIDADFINASLSFLNPLKERELDLRGHQITVIENLGVATDHDALDFTDNQIPQLGNFPLSPRLRTLLLARNRISVIQPNLHESIPNLTTLILLGNRLKKLPDLNPLGGFTRLTHLVLLENEVCKEAHYRYWVIWLCPSVRFLDYSTVKDSERKRAVELFGSATAPSAKASEILNIKSKTFEVPSSSSIGNDNQTSSADGVIRLKLTPKERERAMELIRKANKEEIAMLERMLTEGKVPGGDDALLV